MPIKMLNKEGKMVGNRFSLEEVTKFGWLGNPGFSQRLAGPDRQVAVPDGYIQEDGYNYYLLTPFDQDPWANADLPPAPVYKEGFVEIFGALKPKPTGDSVADRTAVVYWNQVHGQYEEAGYPLTDKLPTDSKGKKTTKARIKEVEDTSVALKLGRPHYYILTDSTGKPDWYARFPESEYVGLLPDLDIPSGLMIDNFRIVVAQITLKLLRLGVDIGDPSGWVEGPKELVDPPDQS